MLRTILKAYKSKVGALPNYVTPKPDVRNYTSEATDYVLGVHFGKIDGVDPGIVDQCPVCSKILRELNVDPAEANHDQDHVSAEVDLATKIWVGLWLLHHDAASHIHDYGFEAEA